MYASNIKTWKQFARRVRAKGIPLLRRLDQYPDCILVSGCQRSGTTMLSRIITGSEGMVRYQYSKDDELDAALILCGAASYHASGRHCFQTTYLNDCYYEYFDHDRGYQLIWVLRNPFSVVYSMVRHWRGWALNELFKACGADLLQDPWLRRYRCFGTFVIPKLVRACLAYNAKTMQLFALHGTLAGPAMMVVEYDELVNDSDRRLPSIYRFVGLDYHKDYGRQIHGKSVRKKNRLTAAEQALIREMCLPKYEAARRLLS